MMLLDVLSFGAPKTAKKKNVRGNDGGFVFQIEILGCWVKKKKRKISCCGNISPLITRVVH